MVGVSDNRVGLQPSRGYIAAQRILSGHQGANAALKVFGRGKYLLGGWCGSQSTVDIWQVEPFRALQSVTLEMQLADMAAGAEAPLVIPPGVSADRSDWAPHLVPIVDASVCASGARIVVAGGRGVRILELDGQQVQWRRRDIFRGHTATLTACVLNTDGELGASADQSGTVLLWDTESARELHRLRITTVPQCMSFIWQDHLLAVGDDRGRVICWEVTEGRRHLQFQAHRGAVTSLQFDAATGCLLTAGADGCARLWNLERGQQVGADMQHSGPIHAAIIVNEGRFVLTGGADGLVAVWSAQDGLLLDWYNDGSPVFGLSAEDAIGTVVASGARAVKMLHLDRVMLRDVALSASRLSQMRQAQQVQGYVAPPAVAAVNYAGGAFQAPVGSVMAARQTSDLPVPEQSAARIDRSQQGGLQGATGHVPAADSSHAAPIPPIRFAPSTGAPPATQAMSAIVGPPIRSGSESGTPASSLFGAPLNSAPLSGGWSGAPASTVPFGPPTSAAPATASFADGFFGASDAGSPAAQAASAQLPFQVSQQSSQAATRPVTPLAASPIAGRGVADAPARQSLSGDAAIVAAGVYAGRTMDELILEGAPKSKPAEITAPQGFPAAAAGIVAVLALLVALGTHLVSNQYYSTTGVPEGLQNRPVEIESSYDSAVTSAVA
ncbi:MAG: hypothetical protein KGO50_08220, partial [Myxococcales bacterium]|nr:hypothetical protein [Myxococcales bacterium]